MRFLFVVSVPVTLRIAVQADSLEEAMTQARLAPVSEHPRSDEWGTCGELDAEPTKGRLIDVVVGKASLANEDAGALVKAQAAWETP